MVIFFALFVMEVRVYEGSFLWYWLPVVYVSF